eukprot:1643399-Pyramimonas_sp.AAC.1
MDNICQDDSQNAHCFADLARVADPVQTFRCSRPAGLMIPMSSLALLQPELRARTDSTSQGNSNDTNSFADLARILDRVQTSQCRA